MPHFSETRPSKHIQAQPKRENCPYIFPSEFSDGHFVGLPRILARVCAAAEIEGVTLPTLRHTFASIAGELGFSELTICTLLGHAPPGADDEQHRWRA